MRKEYYFIIALVVFAALLFGFGSRVGLALQTALRGGFVLSTTDLTASLGDTFAPNSVAAGLSVPVYSQYPLNLKNQLSIAAGTDHGIKVGDIALSGGYVVGVVEKTFERSALVQTIFDRRFQSPVRIGTVAADALLRGANDPELTLIPMNADVSDGDYVYAAANGMPYGAPIGSVRNLHDAGDKVFRQALLFVPYNVGSLESLIIIPSSKQ